MVYVYKKHLKKQKEFITICMSGQFLITVCL